MAKSLRQQVLDLCELHGCSLTEYHGSHFVVTSKTFNDPRTWITNSHSLTAHIYFNYANHETNLNEAYRDLLEYLKQGFVDRGIACDDQGECETCRALGRS